MAAARAPFNVTGKTAPTAAEVPPHSPWHSPVPYLFGGLAAMLGLIAFALLILACSYWKLSGYLDNGDGERDLEAGEGKQGETEKMNQSASEPKFLVIMAGEVKPTFLATPASSSRSSSFGNKSEKSSGEEEREKSERAEKEGSESGCVCGENNNQVRSGSTLEEAAETQSRGGD